MRPAWAALSIWLLFAATLSAQDSTSYRRFLLEQSTPPEVRAALQASGHDPHLQISYRLNPFYLRGDFNADGVADVAILIQERASQKHGIAVVHGGDSTVTVLGAGASLGNGGDDFRWLNVWRVRRKGPLGRGADQSDPPMLMGEAIYVAKAEAASAIIYWDGQKYVWYQQGD